MKIACFMFDAFQKFNRDRLALGKESSLAIKDIVVMKHPAFDDRNVVLVRFHAVNGNARRFHPDTTVHPADAEAALGSSR